VARKNRSIENNIKYRKPTFLLSIVGLYSYTDEKTGEMLEHRCEVKGYPPAQQNNTST
jgi:hypothetical protein